MIHAMGNTKNRDQPDFETVFLAGTVRIAMAVALWCGGLLTNGVAAEEEPVEFQQERVWIELNFLENPRLVAGDKLRVQQQARDIVRRLVGARWDVTFMPGRTLSLGDLTVLESMSMADLPIDRRAASEEVSVSLPSMDAPDKYFRVAIVPESSGFMVGVREWDRISDSLGHVVQRRAIGRDEIAMAMMETIVEAYRPVAQVEQIDEKTQLRIRGVGLPTPEAELLAPRVGALFRVLYHRHNRDAELVDIQPVPYTYLALTGEEGTLGEVAVHSALRSALGTRRGLVTAWAVAAPISQAATTLRVVREKDGLPLAGRRVEIHAERFQPAQKQQPAPLEELLTDRNGQVRITPDPEHALVWATIRSGSAVLMRIPMAPGVERELELRVGDDQRRLDAEGRLAILTGELIETVASRATLIAKARRLSRDGKFDEAKASLDQAAALPNIRNFQRRLASIETPAVVAAEEAGERHTAARIRALANQTGKLITRYLNPEPLQTAREEVLELEAAVKNN